MAESLKIEQRHGKDRVRVARVWKDADGTHHFVEWNVSIRLLSDCIPSYVSADNSSIVATDTMKNTVYVKAKECSERLPVEDFAIKLAKHFTTYYDVVSSAIIKIVEKQWERISIDGQPHKHGFKLGSEKHTTEVDVNKTGFLRVTSGISGLRLLKTTKLSRQRLSGAYATDRRPKVQLGGRNEKSGFEGYIRDKYTLLPETRERLLGTELTASWRYPFESLSSIPMQPFYFLNKYVEVKQALVNSFFGHPSEGVYSPSVQSTLYHMAKDVLARFPDVAEVHLSMPNIHFIPVNLSSKDNTVIVKFEDDVYLPTDEPHGAIEASLSRKHSRM